MLVEEKQAPEREARYADMWRRAGMPSEWRIPAPIFEGRSGQHKYVYCAGVSANQIFTLAAGTSAVLLFSPGSKSAPCYCTNGSTVFPYTLQETLLDRATNVPIHTSVWTNKSPVDLITDPYSIKSGGYVLKPSSTTRNPPLTQLVGGCMSVQVQSSANGQFAVTMLGESECPTWGRQAQTHDLDVATTAPYLQSIPPGMTGQIRLSNAIKGSMSAAEIIRTLGKPHLCGGANFTGVLHAAPEHSWHYDGMLDEADAPTGAASSVAENMRPRYNPINDVQYGGVYISNTGDQNITVMYRAKMVYAAVLRTEQDVGSNALAQQLALNTRTLTTNTREASMLSLSPETSAATDGLLLSGNSDGVTVAHHSETLQNIVSTTPAIALPTDTHTDPVPPHRKQSWWSRAWDKTKELAVAAGKAALNRVGQMLLEKAAAALLV